MSEFYGYSASDHVTELIEHYQKMQEKVEVIFAIDPACEMPDHPARLEFDAAKERFEEEWDSFVAMLAEDLLKHIRVDLKCS